MKKLLSLILAIALVLSLVPAVFAAEGEATKKTELRIKYDILGAVKKLGVSWESSVGVDGEKRVPFTNIDFALTDGFFSFKDSSCGIFTGHSELNYNNICGFQISSNDWIAELIHRIQEQRCMSMVLKWVNSATMKKMLLH